MAPWKFKDFDHDPDIPDEHIEDRMAKEAVAFMEKNRETPFFLNYWMFSVHAPFDAKRALIDKYRKQVDKTDPQRSPTYAAMIESMDDAVGTLLDTLDRLKISDNTIIVFASDNGGNMYQVDDTSPTSNRRYAEESDDVEGGVRGPAIVVIPTMFRPLLAATKTFRVAILSDCTGTTGHQASASIRCISIVPAHGRTLKREAIFTYFPHQTRVPDLPPSVSVHAGD